MTTTEATTWRVDSEGIWLCPEHLDSESLLWPAVEESEADGAQCEFCDRRAQTVSEVRHVTAVARALHNHTGIDEVDWDNAAVVAIAAYEAS